MIISLSLSTSPSKILTDNGTLSKSSFYLKLPPLAPQQAGQASEIFLGCIFTPQPFVVLGLDGSCVIACFHGNDIHPVASFALLLGH